MSKRAAPKQVFKHAPTGLLIDGAVSFSSDYKVTWARYTETGELVEIPRQQWAEAEREAWGVLANEQFPRWTESWG